MPAVAVEGYVSARRYAPVEGYGPHVVVYELEGDPQAARENITAASASGKLQMSDTLCMEPTPEMRVMRLVSEHRPDDRS